jgi:hypothetical protein
MNMPALPSQETSSLRPKSREANFSRLEMGDSRSWPDDTFNQLSSEEDGHRPRFRPKAELSDGPVRSLTSNEPNAVRIGAHELLEHCPMTREHNEVVVRRYPADLLNAAAHLQYENRLPRLGWLFRREGCFN